MTVATQTPPTDKPAAPAQLTDRISHLGPREAAKALMTQGDRVIAEVLQPLNHAAATEVLDRFSPERRQAIIAAAEPATGRQWAMNLAYPPDSVGRLMDAPIAVFAPGLTVARAIEELRQLVKHAFVTYAYVVDPDGRLLGVVVMRELMLATHSATLGQIMLKEPFWLNPELSQMDAMRAVLGRHYPVYPVCDGEGRLVGLVRGSTLFERQAFELTAQAGSMVGVEKEERFATPWKRSLKMRHPWLQLNLLTAFAAAAVVGTFEDTIDRVVVLAVFLPVLAGQSGNTGCQALAVALRAMTLGELKSGSEAVAVAKEAVLGVLNGALVGVVAGIGMFIYATLQGNEAALTLALIVLLAMTGSCLISGIAGVLIPLVLRRLGADPATASSIFLTTATDVASMGLFLALASLLV